MAFFSAETPAFIFGLLGNIVAFLVFLAPLPTFYQIYKKKSSEGYQSIPYLVALFSATLLLYYAFIKKHAFMIVSINGIGCIIEITYISIYVYYAPKKAQMFTLGLLLGFNVLFYGSVVLLTFFLAEGNPRVKIVGWICAAINIAVFVSPLSIMRRVIRTKSVEYMPFLLSFFLTLCATMWFFYGFFVKDFYIAVPNILGFLFGVAQMILYAIYKNAKNSVVEVEKTMSQDSTLSSKESAIWKQMEDDRPAAATGLELKGVVCEKPVQNS